MHILATTLVAALVPCSTGLRKVARQHSRLTNLTLSCADGDSSCGYWAGEGYCSPSSEYYGFMQETCCASCGFGGGCTDNNVSCAGWAGQGYCSTSSQYYQFMQDNCCASCGFGGEPAPTPPAPTPSETCESQWGNMACAGSECYTCGDRITYLINTGYSSSAARTTVGNEFTVACGACVGSGGPSPSPTPPAPPPSSCVDLNESCGGWVGQGYCSPSSEHYQYMQDNCCASCGFGGGPAPAPGPPSSGACVGLSTNANSATAKNIIIVPSGFTSSSDWASFASSVNSDLKQYTPLNADAVSSLNTWYVSDFMPGDYGNKCWFDATTTRLLLCQVEEFRAHADQKCGFGRDASLVVVHNTETYGGAGYMTADVATMTRNYNSAGLAAHELGHSFLGLSDEYHYAGSGGGSDSPNCDAYSSCNKWSDLRGLVQSGYFPGRQVGCVPGCLNNASWTSMSSTIMRDIQNTDFGLVNERQTCCKYLNYAGSHGIPGYCNQFNSYGLNLNSHCSQYASLGAQYTEIEKPVLWRLTRVDGDVWRCDRQKSLKKGVYQAWRQRGDDPEDAAMSAAGTPAGIRVTVEDLNSGEKIEKWFADHYIVEVPLQDENMVHVGSHDRVAQKRDTVDIVLSEGQTCHLA